MENHVESDPQTEAADLKKLKVWLVDDNDRLRELLGQLLALEADIECARQFSSPNQVLSTLASRPGPDVILLDVQLGDHNGIDAVRPIKSLAPGTRVLMFTTCFDPAWRQRALSEGASDYLLKTSGIDRVVDQIRFPANDANPFTRLRRRARRQTKDTSRSESFATVPATDARPLKQAFNFLRGWWN